MEGRRESRGKDVKGSLAMHVHKYWLSTNHLQQISSKRFVPLIKASLTECLGDNDPSLKMFREHSHDALAFTSRISKAPIACAMQ